jgi:transformation/transcription domain-associated protein
MKTPQDLFLMRKSFTLNIASVSFITYVAALQQRNLARFNVSTASGQIYMSELLRESTILSPALTRKLTVHIPQPPSRLTRTDSRYSTAEILSTSG